MFWLFLVKMLLIYVMILFSNLQIYHLLCHFFQFLCYFACYAGFHLPPPLPWKRFSKSSSTYWSPFLWYRLCYCIISFQYSLKFLFLFTLSFSFHSFPSYLSSFVVNIMFSWILSMIPFWFFNIYFWNLCRKPFSKGYSSSGSYNCYSYSLPPCVFYFYSASKKGGGGLFQHCFGPL